jgi:hypothetical protein
MRTVSGLGLLLAMGIPANGFAVDWNERVTLLFSERVRGEFTDWFRPPGNTAGAERYNFLGSQLRIGVALTLPHVQLVVEGQDTRLANLPDDASDPPGPLGPGATYFLNTRATTQGEPFLKRGFLTVRRSGLAATVGRFEYQDGLETEPADPTLAFLKRTRIAERLVGAFGFTHVSRSFDGGRLSLDRPDWNVTAMALRPTQGGFEVSANREIDGVGLAGLAVTLRRVPGSPPADVRFFYLYYDDRRDAPVKADNDPKNDHGRIAVHSGGAHAVTVVDAGPGRVDALVWMVIQGGAWGRLNHRAWAYALEAGYQLPRVPWEPWLRGGYNQSSGDDDPADGHHGTFFPLIPTARIYAQLPFYNLMNVSDLFAELLLRPHRRVLVRTDYHWLQLTEHRDRWYAGSGAITEDGFGYTSARSGDHRDLAHLVDVSIAVELHARLALNAYYGHAFGQDVVGTTFAGTQVDYGFLELFFRY